VSELRHRPRKRFSQNFLHERHFIERIAAAIDPRPGERIVEIGPGEAALTQALLDRVEAIDAVEIDRDLAAMLRQRFAAHRLRLHVADGLEFDWRGFAQANGSLRIVGNLPYHVSTPLLFALVPIAAQVLDQHFLLQREVVERMVAPPGSKIYGRLSVMLQFRYAMSKRFDVPAGAFRPVPAVVSSLVRMVPRPVAELPEVDAGAFARVVAAAFGQRRKTLRNALSGLLDESALGAAGVDPQARAETLPVEAFVRLALAVADVARTAQSDAVPD
jgi:16S rRNA (adenine1518-N6/adenine1519-N6)-dimethyltransferase